MRTYFKFLAKNKLYTFVNVIGFSISLMFVFLLGIYVIQNFSIDKFHEKKDRIYLLGISSTNVGTSNPVGEYVQNLLPEVESYTRIIARNVNVKKENVNSYYYAMFADSTFFNIFTYDLIEGNPSHVLNSKTSAVLSQSFADLLFPGENPIGKSFLVSDNEVIVTGIMENMPNNSHLPVCDFILNYQMIENYWDENILNEWGNSSFATYFLEKEGSDLRAKSEFLLENFKKDYWLYSMGYSDEVFLFPLEEIYFNNLQSGNIGFNSNSKFLVYTYFAITLLILIVAILNYINLSVSQASSRGKEAAIKKLLGSSKKRIIFQFISESVFVSILASIFGILLSFIAEPFFNDVLSINLNFSKHLTFTNLIAILVGVIIIGIISGLFPALVVSRYKPIEVVKGTYSLKVKTVYSKVLITFQYFVAISLLICGSFLILQTNYLKNYNLGFDKDKVFLMDNILDTVKIKNIKNELLRIPGVENVSLSAGTPLDGGNNNSFEYNGEPLSFQTFFGDSAFFDIYGIELFPFDNDIQDNTIWLNQKGLEVLQLNKDNNKFKIWNEELTVSGTTNNFNFKSLHEEIGPAIIAYENDFLWPWTISVKIAASANPFKTADEIKRVYSEYSGGNLFESHFADDRIQEKYEEENKISKIIIAFAILTIIILMMGIFAMSLYYVKQKEKEIAVRKVSGANEAAIMKMLNMNFIRLVIIAFIVAVPLSYFVMQKWLQGFAFKISLSWWVFILSGIFIIVLSIIFVSLQSWRIANKNPVESLKNE